MASGGGSDGTAGAGGRCGICGNILSSPGSFNRAMKKCRVLQNNLKSKAQITEELNLRMESGFVANAVFSSFFMNPFHIVRDDETPGAYNHTCALS